MSKKKREIENWRLVFWVEDQVEEDIRWKFDLKITGCIKESSLCKEQEVCNSKIQFKSHKSQKKNENQRFTANNVGVIGVGWKLYKKAIQRS